MTAMALEDEFLALLCEDEEALRAEFDAIIAANWDEPPPVPVPRQPVPRTPYRSTIRPLRTETADPVRLPRQRSPPKPRRRARGRTGRPRARPRCPSLRTGRWCHVDFDFDDGWARGLRDYVRHVGEALGLTGDSSYVEVDQPFSAYLALDGTLPCFPYWDVALLWQEDDGWAVAVEPDSAEDPVVLAHMGGEPLPPPRAVADWVKGFLRDGLVAQPPPNRHLPVHA
ncbi:MAG: DUF6292 family protein [Umezawaea sp.]